MNQGQEKFQKFILERVKEDQSKEALELLAEHFKKQDEGTFNHEDAEQFIPKMTSMLKPEHVEEVQAIMKQFAQKI